MIFSVRLIFSVGGIYTVLRTKAAASTDQLGDNYVMLGPYSYERSRMEFDKRDYAEDDVMNNALAWTRECGFEVKE